METIIHSESAFSFHISFKEQTHMHTHVVYRTEYFQFSYTLYKEFEQVFLRDYQNLHMNLNEIIDNINNIQIFLRKLKKKYHIRKKEQFFFKHFIINSQNSQNSLVPSHQPPQTAVPLQHDDQHEAATETISGETVHEKTEIDKINFVIYSCLLQTLYDKKKNIIENYRKFKSISGNFADSLSPFLIQKIYFFLKKYTNTSSPNSSKTNETYTTLLSRRRCESYDEYTADFTDFDDFVDFTHLGNIQRLEFMPDSKNNKKSKEEILEIFRRSNIVIDLRFLSSFFHHVDTRIFLKNFGLKFTNIKKKSHAALSTHTKHMWILYKLSKNGSRISLRNLPEDILNNVITFLGFVDQEFAK